MAKHSKGKLSRFSRFFTLLRMFYDEWLPSHVHSLLKEAATVKVFDYSKCTPSNIFSAPQTFQCKTKDGILKQVALLIK